MYANAVAAILVSFDVRHRRPLGDKAPAARGDHDDGRDEFGPRVSLQSPTAVGQLFQTRRHLVEVILRAERLDLVQKLVRQLLAGDDVKTGNVIDRFSGWSSVHCPPGRSRISTRCAFRSRRPSSNTAKRPMGPAPTMTTSVSMGVLISYSTVF